MWSLSFQMSHTRSKMTILPKHSKFKYHTFQNSISIKEHYERSWQHNFWPQTRAANLWHLRNWKKKRIFRKKIWNGANNYFINHLNEAENVLQTRYCKKWAIWRSNRGQKIVVSRSNNGTFYIAKKWLKSCCLWGWYLTFFCNLA